MSINIYLEGEKVKEKEGFATKERRVQGEKWDEYSLPGVRLHHEKGRWFTTLSETMDPIPSALEDIIDEISLREIIPIRPKRETGLYHHESAKAEIVVYGEKHFEVSIRGKKIQDVLDLFRLIRTGSIRPDESYEGEQSGMSRAELETKLKSLETDLKFAQERLQLFRDTRDREKTEIGKFVGKLIMERWPFCTKRRVINLLTKQYT